MSAFATSILVVWVLFWAYWLISATRAKQGSGSGRSRLPRLIIIVVLAFGLRSTVKVSGVSVHQPILQAFGMILFLSGLGLAIWARINLGRNWGMPMTVKDEPELVTSGPYHLVRHPIYSGLLLGLLGTSLAINISVLIAVGVMGIYFIYSARAEERILTTSFPAAYPSYRARTKMLIPFVL